MGKLLPLPDEEGIRKTKAFYREEHGREITDEEAIDILGMVMRYLYLTSGASDTPEEAERRRAIEGGPAQEDVTDKD